MKKYPAVYTYRSTPDHGNELKHSIRSLANLIDWDGRVFIIGDSEDWFSKNITHYVTHSKFQDPYKDVDRNLFIFNSDDSTPEEYIYMMDDVYITESCTVDVVYRGFIKDAVHRSTHTTYLKATGEMLSKNHGVAEPLNYEVHSPFLVSKDRWLKTYEELKQSLDTPTPLQWKSIYGNMFNIGGDFYEDRKAYDSHLLQGRYISSSFFTNELSKMFPSPSSFEKRIKRIAIVSHFSPIKMTTGMIKLVNYIAEYLSSEYAVDVIAVRETFPPSIKIGNVGYYLGRTQLQHLNNYDLVIAHPPMNVIDHPNLVLFYDSDKDTNTPSAPQNISHKMAIFTTEHIRKQYGVPGIILHPVVKPQDHRTTRGDMITLVGASEYKGVNVIAEVAKLMPEKNFLVVKSGWQKEAQIVPRLANVYPMNEVADLKEIWKRTHILVAPSKGEQYGMASLEAMASGIPVIAYSCPGVIEALGDAAVLMETFTPSDWVDAINRVEENYEDYVAKSEAQSEVVDSEMELKNLMIEINKLCQNQ